MYIGLIWLKKYHGYDKKDFISISETAAAMSLMAKGGGDGPGFVGIRFCQECNNMLYPKEDKVIFLCVNL